MDRLNQETGFKLGDKVILQNKDNLNDQGIIRYIGNVDEKPGIWYGIELNEPKGKNDGSHKGKVYFQCKPAFGILTTAKNLKPYKRAPIRAKDPSQVVGAGTTTSSSRIGLGKTQVGVNDTKYKEQIKQLEEKLTQCQTELQQKQEQLEKTQDQLGDTAENLEKLTETFSLVEKEKEDLNSFIEEQQSLIDELKQKASQPFIDPNDTDIGKMQKYVKLQQDLVKKDDEIMELNQQLKKMKKENENDKNQNSIKIENLQTVVIQKNNEIEEFQKQHDKQTQMIAQLQEQLEAQERASLKPVQDTTKINELNEQIEKLKKEIQQFKDTQEEEHEKMELLTLEVETLQIDKENLEEELSSTKNELEKVTEKAEKAQQDLIDNQQAIEKTLEDDDNLNSLSSDELKKQNIQLNHTINVLNDRIEEEQIRREEVQLELEEKILDLQLKLDDARAEKKQHQKTLDELNIKKAEIEELKLQLDESNDAVFIAEQVTQEKLKLEDQIYELEKEISYLKENSNLDQELMDELKESEKDLQNQLMNKEYDIYELNQKLKNMQTEIQDSEQQILKYKEKSALTQKQYELVQEELENTLQGSSNNENLKKYQQLLEDYQDLLQERREIYKDSLQSQITSNYIQLQDIYKNQLLVDSIPSKILKELKQDVLNIFIQSKKAQENCQLAIREFTKLLKSDKLVKSENEELAAWIYKLLIELTEFSSQIYQFDSTFYNIQNEEQANKIKDSQIKSNILLGGQFIEQILRSLMDDTISSSTPTQQIQNVIKNIKEDQDGFQIKDEDIQWKSNILVKVQCLNHQLNKKFFDLKFLQLDHNIDLLYHTLYKRLKEFAENLLIGGKIPKSKQLIENYIENIQESFNYIDEVNSINFFSNNQNLQGETLQTENSDEENIQASQVESNIDPELLPHIEKLRTNTINLTNTLNYVNAETSQQLQFENKEERPAYWKKLSQKVLEEIKNVEQSIENEKNLQIQLDDINKKYLFKEKELNDYKEVKEALEKRVVQSELKNDKVNVLEQEVKSFKLREKHYNDAAETLKKEIENLKRKNKDLEDKYEQIREQQGISNQGSEIQGNQSSLIKNFKAPSLSGKGSSILAGKNSMIQQQVGSIMNEEAGTLLKFFRRENCQLRNREIRERINQLHDNSNMIKLYRKAKNLKRAAPEVESDKENENKQDNDLNLALSRMNNIQNQILNNYVENKIINLNDLARVYNTENKKREFITQYISGEDEQLQKIRSEAYSIQNSILKTINGKNNFKVRNMLNNQNLEQRKSQMVKLATFEFEESQIEVDKLEISNNEWRQIKVQL